MKDKPAYLHEVPRVLDYPTRLQLQQRRLMEQRQTFRRDMAEIVILWATRAYQKAHTDEPESIA